MKSDLIDIQLYFHLETEKAVKFSEDGIQYDGFFLPKSQIEYKKSETAKDHRIYDVTLPEWLAKEKGLI